MTSQWRQRPIDSPPCCCNTVQWLEGERPGSGRPSTVVWDCRRGVATTLERGATTTETSATSDDESHRYRRSYAICWRSNTYLINDCLVISMNLKNCYKLWTHRRHEWPSSAEGAALLRQHASGWLGQGVTVIQRNSSNAREWLECKGILSMSDRNSWLPW